MKPISMFPLLAIIISPALSQPHATADDNPSGVTIPTSTSDVLDFGCHKSNALISGQLAEITHLQSRNIPVTHDLAGYFYAVVRGRKKLGCSNLNPFTSQSDNTTSAQTLSKRSSSDEARVVEELCKPARELKEEVMEQITVLQEYGMQIPDFLAGWWSVTKDADQFLKCGFENMELGTVDGSATADS